MKETRKSRSMIGMVGEAEAFLRQNLLEKPRAWLLDAREKARDLPKTNFELGVRFAGEGKWYDAMFRFKIVVFLNPAYPQALFNLGCCYYNLGKTEQARAALVKVLAAEPGNTDAILMLSAIDPGAVSPNQRPKRIPAELVVSYFGGIAENYNTLEAQQQYRGGKTVAEQVKPLLPAQGIYVVDLGCGTGIASIPYRAVASQMVGVDLTPAMAAQARNEGSAEKKLFDQVVEADVTQPLDALPSGMADLVLLVNVAQFLGALDVPLQQAARLLKPQGILAVTLEPYSGRDGYGIVTETSQFGHSAAYVKQLASAVGLEAAKQMALSLYAGSSAELILLRKAG